MLCGLGYDLSCLWGVSQKRGLKTDCFPVSVNSLGGQFLFLSQLSAALEISFILRILSLKQYEATTFTGAPG